MKKGIWFCYHCSKKGEMEYRIGEEFVKLFFERDHKEASGCHLKPQVVFHLESLTHADLAFIQELELVGVV